MAPITITIKDTDLKSVNSMTDDRASKIITSAKKAMINGKIAEVANPTKSSIDVKTSDGLDGDRWTIVLTTEKDEVVALLRYDLNTKKFVPEEEEDQEEDEPYIVEAPDIVDALDNLGKVIAPPQKK